MSILARFTKNSSATAFAVRRLNTGQSKITQKTLDSAVAKAQKALDAAMGAQATADVALKSASAGQRAEVSAAFEKVSDTTVIVSAALEDAKAAAAAHHKAVDGGGQTDTDALGAIAAILPKRVTAAYTTIASALSVIAVGAGKDAKSAYADMHAGEKYSDITDHLNNMPTEGHIGWLDVGRYVLMLVGLTFSVLWGRDALREAHRRAGVPMRKNAQGKVRVSRHPLPWVCGLAFLIWAAASPGTPLLSYLNPAYVLVVEGGVVLVGALVLYGCGERLTKWTGDLLPATSSDK